MKEKNLQCPNCWRDIYEPQMFDSEYNMVFQCDHCKTPYLIFDASFVSIKKIVPEDVLVQVLGVDKTQVEFFKISGFDLTENAQSLTDVTTGEKRGPMEWGSECVFWAARPNKE